MRIFEITDDKIIKGPWGDKKIAKDGDGYGTMIDVDSGKKVSKPIDISKMKQISWSQAFGGTSEYNTIDEMGYELQEKPSYFDNIKSAIPKGKLATIQRKLNRKLHTYALEDIIEPHKGVYYPQSDANWNALQEDEETFIVRASKDSTDIHGYRAGDMFLANRTGAISYIRMWAKVV